MPPDQRRAFTHADESQAHATARAAERVLRDAAAAVVADAQREFLRADAQRHVDVARAGMTQDIRDGLLYETKRGQFQFRREPALAFDRERDVEFAARRLAFEINPQRRF